MPADRAAALTAYVESHRATPFAWGVHDCCLFAAGAVLAQTGNDPAASFRGRYTDRRGARTLIHEELGGSIEAIPAALGFTEIALRRAGRGDLVTAQTIPNRPASLALGVLLGTRAAFAGKHGLLFLPSSACLQAWRVA